MTTVRLLAAFAAGVVAGVVLLALAAEWAGMQRNAA